MSATIRSLQRCRMLLALAATTLLVQLVSAQPRSMLLGERELDVPVVDAEALRAGREKRLQGQLQRGNSTAIDTVVLCPPAFQSAIETWVNYRRLQGHGIKILDGEQSAKELQSAIRRIAAQHPLRYVVIFGDADPGMATSNDIRRRCIPTFYVEARVNTRWGSEPYIASDNPYGDLDDDHVPELAVGRIPCDSPRQVTEFTQRVIQYETQLSAGLWRRQLNFVAGIGGFGSLADSAIESAAKKFITEMIPPEYVTTMTYGSWRSPFCPDPRCFRDAVLQRAQSGGLFWIYMGHGNVQRLDPIGFGEAIVPVMEIEDVPRFGSRTGPPIAVLLACYTGAFDQEDDCLAEQLVLSREGPIAAICGTRVTMPYGMALFGISLIQAYFRDQVDCLGDAFVAAKRATMVEPTEMQTHRKLLDAVAMTLSPSKDDLRGERLEHLVLFHLLGDPLLKLDRAEPIEVSCRRHIEAGQTLQVRGKSPVGGKCLVELVCRRDRLTFATPRRSQIPMEHEALSEMNEVYARANDQRWTGRRIDIQPGNFVADLVVPAHAQGSSYVRVFVEGDRRHGLGAAPIYIQATGATDPLRTTNARR